MATDITEVLAMAKGDSQLLCPTCGREAGVKPGGTGHRMLNGELPRWRLCPVGHEFRTFERREGLRLAQVVVMQVEGRPPSRGRRSVSAGRSVYEAFDLNRLKDDLKKQLLGTLSNPDLDDVIRTAVHDLDARLDAVAKPLTTKSELAGTSHFITYKDVREAVMRALKTLGRPPKGSANHRVAHVLYALSTEGATHFGKSGWSSAREVVEWMLQEYTDLPPPPDRFPDQAPVIDRWWPPSQPPPTIPRTVIKRHPKLRRPSGPVENEASAVVGGIPTEDFVPRKFEQSIENALVGRGEEEDTAKRVAAWVLWSLLGQDRVLTSQLGAAVADCLRRLDDIGYLRWVAAGKELRVSWLYAEAVGLAMYPSPKLVFDPAYVPPMLPSKAPGRSG